MSALQGSHRGRGGMNARDNLTGFLIIFLAVLLALLIAPHVQWH
jgi:hypothetical protein